MRKKDRMMKMPSVILITRPKLINTISNRQPIPEPVFSHSFSRQLPF
jgi:hypothetical protein